MRKRFWIMFSDYSLKSYFLCAKNSQHSGLYNYIKDIWG